MEHNNTKRFIRIPVQYTRSEAEFVRFPQLEKIGMIRKGTLVWKPF